MTKKQIAQSAKHLSFVTDLVGETALVRVRVQRIEIWHLCDSEALKVMPLDKNGVEIGNDASEFWVSPDDLLPNE